MAAVNFFKVSGVPANEYLQNNSLYFVYNSENTFVDFYLTGSDAATYGAHNVSNTAAVNALIDSKLTSFTNLKIVSNIEARDALTLTSSSFVLVADATDDSTVKSGAALYVYDAGTGYYTKVTEYESLDILDLFENKAVLDKFSEDDGSVNAEAAGTVLYDGRPLELANRTQVDKIGEDTDGNLTYNGSPVNAVTNWSAIEW
jgi:hypothetical protein